MSTISYDRPDDYETFIFGTWYHNIKQFNGSFNGSRSDEAKQEFLNSKKSFYKFFEEI